MFFRKLGPIPAKKHKSIVTFYHHFKISNISNLEGRFHSVTETHHLGQLVVSTHLKNMLVKLDHFPRDRGEKKIELPPPSWRLHHERCSHQHHFHRIQLRSLDWCWCHRPTPRNLVPRGDPAMRNSEFLRQQKIHTKESLAKRVFVCFIIFEWGVMLLLLLFFLWGGWVWG